MGVDKYFDKMRKVFKKMQTNIIWNIIWIEQVMESLTHDVRFLTNSPVLKKKHTCQLNEKKQQHDVLADLLTVYFLFHFPCF